MIVSHQVYTYIKSSRKGLAFTRFLFYISLNIGCQFDGYEDPIYKDRVFCYDYHKCSLKINQDIFNCIFCIYVTLIQDFSFMYYDLNFLTNLPHILSTLCNR